MEVKYQIDETTLRLFFIGELDEHSAKGVKTKLDELIESVNVKRVVFEFGQLNFTDSTGIGLLIGRYKLLKSRQVAVFINEPKPQIEKVLKMTGIFQIMPKIG
ncbi:MAG: STAS domain-containing protein [Clostridia bacterium]